jgi:hypothetical protein
MNELTAVVKAREFIRRLKLNAVPVDIERCLQEANASCKICYDLANDEAGYTAPIAGKQRIFVNGRQTRERQRFTILHEIAHIVLCLPSIHDSILKTTTLMSYACRPQEEVCCDAFAAECLLPYDIFKNDVDRHQIGFESIEQLAADYRASLTCTGSRYAVVNAAPCAFVLSEAGVVRYVSSSQSMKERRCWIKIGMPLPKGSAAQKIRAGGSIDGSIEISAELWIDDPKRGDDYLLEEARLLPEWDQVLSLLWFEEDSEGSDDIGDDREDDGGLKELDGILPWPSKKRRR